MRQNASYLMLKDYFQRLVEKSEFLHDFVGYFSRELHNKEESIKGIKSPFLVLFNYQIGIEGEEMATPHDVSITRTDIENLGQYVEKFHVYLG